MKQFLESANLLETVVAEGEKNSATAQELVRDLNNSQLNWKPAPEKWSIAQCLDHLAVSAHGFDLYFTQALGGGSEKWAVTSPPKYRPSFMGGWLIKQLLPEATRKVPAPKIFRPSSSEIDHPVEKFLAQQKTFLEFVRATEGIDYNKTRLRSPVTPLMRYSLADAYVLTVVHGQRHLQQAQRVRDTPGFPN